jgi:hypothetical protein
MSVKLSPKLKKSQGVKSREKAKACALIILFAVTQ